jgi:hypothetical protein
MYSICLLSALGVPPLHAHCTSGCPGDTLSHEYHSHIVATCFVQEDSYLVQPSEESAFAKKRRRAKSVLPAHLDDLDLNNAFFSSTQAMHPDHMSPVAKPPRRKNARAKRDMDALGSNSSSPKPRVRAALGAGAARASAPARQLAARQAPKQAKASDDSERTQPSKRHTRSMAPLPAELSEGEFSSDEESDADVGPSPARRNGERSPAGPSRRHATPEPAAAEEDPVLSWGSASPRKRVSRPGHRSSLPAHLAPDLALPAEGIGADAARLQRSMARAADSPFQGSAAERARARALGGNPDVMFDRLCTRAGMQMPIVRAVPFDAHALPQTGSLAFYLLGLCSYASDQLSCRRSHLSLHSSFACTATHS